MILRAINTTKHVEKNVMQEFAQRLEESLGLNYPENEWESLARKMEGAAKDFGCIDGSDCIRRLSMRPLRTEEVVLLAKHLTIGETYFFRDTPLFEMLRNKLLPALIQKRRQEGRFLRLWSAACCSGEEPYSLAILLNELIPDISEWTIWILGSDINPNFLKKAEKGIYKPWSFRSTPPEIKNKYFQSDAAGFYQISPKIRKMVKFIELNLIDGIYPSKKTNTQEMDFILCNNVLIYFSEAKIHDTVGHLTDSLSEGGSLIVSPTEVPYIQNDKLIMHSTESMTFFRKCSISQKENSLKTIAKSPLAVPVARPKESLPIKLEKQENQLLFRLKKQFDQRHYQEIVDWAEKASKEELERCRVAELTVIAKSYANRGKLLKAKSLLEIALKAEKLDPELHFFYGTLLEENGEQKEAILAYKRALFLDHNFVLAYYALANIYAMLGEKDEALRNYRNALHLCEANQGLALYETEGITGELLKKLIRSQQKINCCKK